MAAALAPRPGPGHPHPAPTSLSLPSPLPPTTQGGLYGSCQKREALIRRFSSQRDEAPSRTGCHTYKHTLRVIQDFRTQVTQSRNCTVPSQGLKCFSGLRRSKRTGGCPGLLSDLKGLCLAREPSPFCDHPDGVFIQKAKGKDQNNQKGQSWGQGGASQPHYKLLQVSY